MWSVGPHLISGIYNSSRIKQLLDHLQVPRLRNQVQGTGAILQQQPHQVGGQSAGACL
jgi:hypothetical protein